MAHLYELAHEYRELLEAIDADLIPEEAIADTLESLDDELDDKLENIAVFIKELQADADALAEEEKALKARKDSKQKKVDKLTDYLTEQMLLCKRKKLERPRAVITIRSSRAVEVYDEKEFVEWCEDNARDDLLSYKVTPSKSTIKQSLDAGAKIPFTTIIERRKASIK